MRFRTGHLSVPRLRVVLVSALVSVLAVITFAGSGVAGADPAVAGRADSVGAEVPKECVGSTFATLGGIYDAVFDSLLPMMPESVRNDSESIKASAHRDMDGLRISSLAVSNHPLGLGASEDSPSLKYRDPISGYVLTQLMNVRDGTASEAITVENMTLAQAVETVYLYLYVTVIIPMTLVAGTIPPIMPLGPVSLGTLISLPLQLGAMAMGYIYSGLSNGLVDACIISVTQEQKDRAGKPIKDLRFTNQVPQVISDIAAQVLIAEEETCRPIGSLPLSRVLDRTTTYLEQVNTDPAVDGQIADQAARLRDFMEKAPVPHNLIPGDPADFSTIESLLALGLGFVPVVGGAPTQAIVGLAHNYFNGADMSQTIPLADLTVTKSMTAAFYAYSLSTHVLQLGYRENQDLAVSALQLLIPTLTPEQFAQYAPSPFALLSAPKTYGIVVYHNVLRSLCLAEDNVAG